MSTTPASAAPLPLEYGLRFHFAGGNVWERGDPYRFLPTIGELDASARERNVLVVSGANSVVNILRQGATGTFTVQNVISQPTSCATPCL